MTKVISDDVTKQIQGFLWKRHRGVLPADEAILLKRMMRDRDVTEEDAQELLNDVLSRKADAEAEKANPKFPPGEGEMIVPFDERHETLSWAFIERHLRSDAERLDARGIRFHKPSDMSNSDFRYLGELVKAIQAGEIRPGFAVYIHPRSERYQSAGGPGLTLIDPENLPLAFRPEQFAFLRRRGQTEGAFKKALQRMQDTVDERDNIDLARRPASSGKRW